MKTLENSIITNKPLRPLFSLGEIYSSTFLKPGEEPKFPKCELAIGIDGKSGLVQLTKTVESEEMWGQDNYWYRSSTNDFMKSALQDVTKATVSFIGHKENMVWTDIAGNDSTLLSFVENSFRINIDPSAYPEAEQNAELVIRDYFSKEVYFSKIDKKSDVITCISMFYDLDNPTLFLNDVNEVLNNDGIFVLQLSYTPLMLIQGELGNLVFEHCAYYTLKSLKYVLKLAHFKIIDLELNNVNGGSIRVYCVKDINTKEFKTQADRDIAEIKIKALESYEFDQEYNTTKPYLEFYKKCIATGEKLKKFIKREKANGKRFYGFSASTKGNTVLQYYGLGPNEIEKIAERQERKVGLVTVGSNIPIISEEQFRTEQPDYAIVFAWHFISEFVKREREYLEKGGKFIVLSPKFKIIDKDSSI